MKKSMIYLFFALAISSTVMAGNNTYNDNMLQAKSMADSATVEKTFVVAANYFERIASMNSDQWLPHYYAAYCYTRICHLNTDNDKRDSWIDKAQAEVDKAYAINPDNSEVIVMKGFVLQARMSINPMIRGMLYNGEVMGYFNKAMESDPENPRSYLWEGVNIFHTPAMFGGGKENALPFIKKAVEKFEAFAPADSLAPNWGYSYALEMLESCK